VREGHCAGAGVSFQPSTPIVSQSRLGWSMRTPTLSFNRTESHSPLVPTHSAACHGRAASNVLIVGLSPSLRRREKSVHASTSQAVHVDYGAPATSLIYDSATST